MDIKDIQNFLVITEEGNITAAAERLHIAQPPLSRQIIRLERELGVQLLERGKRKVKLTEAGHLLRSRGEQILELMNTTTRELNDFDSGIRGTLSIGAVTATGAALLPNLVKLFRERYPDVTFRLHEGETRRITELLDRGIVDLGIIRLPFDQSLYDSIILPDESLVTVFSAPFQELAVSEPFINVSALENKPLLIHRKFETQITDACQSAGFTPHILCESDDVMPLLTWANAGIGVAVVPHMAANLLPGSGLLYRKIFGSNLMTTSAIIWVKKRYMPATALHFLRILTAENIGSL